MRNTQLAGARGDCAGVERDVARRHERLGHLVDMATADASDDEFLAEVLAASVELTDAEMVAYWRLDARTQTYRMERGIGWNASDLGVTAGSKDAQFMLSDSRADSDAVDAGGVVDSHHLVQSMVVPITEPGRSAPATLGVYAPRACSCGVADGALLRSLAGLVSLHEAKARADRLDVELEQAMLAATPGALVAGVAHDFNNLLGVIRMCAGLIVDEEDSTAAARELADEIRTAAARGSQLSRSLMDLSYRPSSPAVCIDPVSAGQEILRVLGGALSSMLELRLEVEPDLPPVLLPDGDLERVVVNLVLNAAEALRGRDDGSVVVSMRLEDGRPERVVIAVTDNGSGMSEESVRRAPERGFTTKGRADGYGFGLTNVSRIARKAGGEVSIESAPGEGTNVAVRLPPAGPAADGA